VLIFWSAFSPFYPFDSTEPLSQRACHPIRLRRAVHRQKKALDNPGYLILIAEEEQTKEIVGWAGYIKPEACRLSHPWIAEDETLKTDEDREAWEGVDRKVHNGKSSVYEYVPVESLTLMPIPVFATGDRDQAFGKAVTSTGGKSSAPTLITGESTSWSHHTC
jgi:hypothetical protein